MRRALVTGAASGIGRAIAARLEANGEARAHGVPEERGGRAFSGSALPMDLGWTAP